MGGHGETLPTVGVGAFATHQAFKDYEPTEDRRGTSVTENHPSPHPSSASTSRSPSPRQRWTNRLENGPTNYGQACPQVDCDAGEASNSSHASCATAVTLGTPTNSAQPAPVGRGFQEDDNGARFACPNQKFDPIRCRFCCSPHSKNPQGFGADTISRLRAHMFRNHDPSVRCGRCWEVFKTSEWVPRYCDEQACVEKAPGRELVPSISTRLASSAASESLSELFNAPIGFGLQIFSPKSIRRTLRYGLLWTLERD
ncbi:hypothetical protein B0T25DRAFT_8920 [Lasiosphaeria hispida]|uniref:Uncharacterized protein n=1 Tax=Lasiosphaeria hispida TaxID=260671 RepID=A0AAJ0MJD6_9PEZI|nr:hypothetical protein B0T25DRAFT_8920 [Lasiosphaeria hispida]